MKTETHTIHQQQSGNSIIITLVPAKGYRLGSYGNHGTKKGNVQIVITKE